MILLWSTSSLTDGAVMPMDVVVWWWIWLTNDWTGFASDKLLAVLALELALALAPVLILLTIEELLPLSLLFLLCLCLWCFGFFAATSPSSVSPDRSMIWLSFRRGAFGLLLLLLCRKLLLFAPFDEVCDRWWPSGFDLLPELGAFLLDAGCVDGAGNNNDADDDDDVIAADAVAVELWYANCVGCVIELRLEWFGAVYEISCEMEYASDAFRVGDTYSSALSGGRIKLIVLPLLFVFVLIDLGLMLFDVPTEPIIGCSNLPVVA